MPANTLKGDRTMYTRRELKSEAHIIRQTVDEHNVPEEQVKRDMKESMDDARLNPDPIIQARWVRFEYRGHEPT